MPPMPDPSQSDTDRPDPGPPHSGRTDAGRTDAGRTDTGQPGWPLSVDWRTAGGSPIPPAKTVEQAAPRERTQHVPTVPGPAPGQPFGQGDRPDPTVSSFSSGSSWSPVRAAPVHHRG